MEVQEEEEGNGAVTPPLEPRQHELLAAADILTEYQKWVDERSDLVDTIMGMYQVDTSPENVDLEDDEEEERMSTWVNSLTI